MDILVTTLVNSHEVVFLPILAPMDELVTTLMNSQEVIFLPVVVISVNVVEMNSFLTDKFQTTISTGMVLVGQGF
uniref:Uncharacterized protein n=1 Tax=Moorena producens (strain JHB) TaxID=1454205 RepID=A0A1D9G419_MOOP1